MSMIPPIFVLLKQAAAVTALFGTDTVRIFPWGLAPQGTPTPYAVYSVYSGSPENYLGNRPDIDNLSTQLNIYAADGDDCIACFQAIRDVIEMHAHITNFSQPERDAQTQLYSCRIEFDFWNKN